MNLKLIAYACFITFFLRLKLLSLTFRFSPLPGGWKKPGCWSS
jgi:hypothetical protein